MVLELLREGEVVEEEDISDRMVDFVYHRLLPPVEAFLDITSLFCYWPSEEVAYIVGEEEFRALEDATFVKTSEDGRLIVHDIVQARGKKMSEQNRVTDPETLLKCLQDEEKLKNLRGIFLNEKYEHPSIEINDDHLKWMSDSLRVLSYEGSQITFRGKCYKPFRQLRYLQIASNIPDLPMEFEKLEHLSIYRGPLMPGMSFNEFPPSLRVMTSLNLTKMYASSKNRVAYSKIPATKATPDSLLVKLRLYGLKNMERLPDGMENLTKLEQLYLRGCHQLRELPSRFGQLNNLKELRLSQCHELKELPSSIGQLSNLESLHLYDCSALSVLPPSFGDLISLKTLQLSYCSGLKMLPSNLGQLKNLKELDLRHCSGPCIYARFGQLNNLKELRLSQCHELKELPSSIGQLSLKMLPSNLGQLKNLKELDLRHCSGLEEWPLSFTDLTGMKKMVLVVYDDGASLSIGCTLLQVWCWEYIVVTHPVPDRVRGDGQSFVYFYKGIITQCKLGWFWYTSPDTVKALYWAGKETMHWRRSYEDLISKRQRTSSCATRVKMDTSSNGVMGYPQRDKDRGAGPSGGSSCPHPQRQTDSGRSGTGHP
ncbi:disease resistance protein RPV1 [Cryptomeria japonica]|uniref:disease resistance protein RPV1 n=1 Tax=Cryptomeria japonica TaxID=3369 RepID=UPI0027DA6842|nr:disease resistance protein RPV1 [Cryptomeria japonica]